MTPASIVLAIATAAWGPIASPPGPAAAPVAEPPSSAAPAAGAVEPIPSSASGPASVHSPTRPALIAKAPVDVRMRPVLVDPPDRPRPKPLYKRWGFWVISGGLLTSTVIVTILATRPKPQPYIGNAPPFTVPLP